MPVPHPGRGPPGEGGASIRGATLVGVEYARTIVSEVVDIARANRGWMGWNTFLALVPLGLAVLLFARPHRRTVGWWIGVGVFVLFLPNAPYLVTDLIHLRWLVAGASGGSVVVFGILPMMALFITVGLASYLICIELVVREVWRERPTLARPLIELPIHAICAFGVVLGRITRLNSWDTVTTPRNTVERIFNTLEWRGAPFAFLAIFLAIWLSSTVLRTLAIAAWRAVEPVRRRLGLEPELAPRAARTPI